MRILQLAPLWETVPPPAYGGTEAVVSLLTEELVRAGHDVILAASGDSTTSAEHVSVMPRSLRRSNGFSDRNPYDWAHVSAALQRGADCDVIHNHAGELAMAMADLVPTPMLTTTHCATTPDTRVVWPRYRGAYNTISKSQAPHFEPFAFSASYVGHVYNAIDVDSFPFEAEKSEDLLFLSRVAPEKGPQHAIAVAKRLGRRLIMAGKVDQYDRDFFEEVIRGQIDGEQIVFIGEADAAKKRELYKTAKCLLMPLEWDEPFGLVMPEAMACGTPVIAMRRGSAPELIVHGKTGFVVDTVDEMVEAARDLRRIDPRECRSHVQANFSTETMVREYVLIYEQLAEVPFWARKSGEAAVPALPPATEQEASAALAVA